MRKHKTFKHAILWVLGPGISCLYSSYNVYANFQKRERERERNYVMYDSLLHYITWYIMAQLYFMHTSRRTRETATITNHCDVWRESCISSSAWTDCEIGYQAMKNLHILTASRRAWSCCFVCFLHFIVFLYFYSQSRKIPTKLALNIYSVKTWRPSSTVFAL